jgi:hypothetical protein
MGDEADAVQRLDPGKGFADPVEAQLPPLNGRCVVVFVFARAS